MADSHKKTRDEKIVPLKIEARRNLILSAIAGGMSYMNMVQKFTDEWGLGRKTVELAISDAIKWMRDDETKQTLVDMNMARLDSLIEDSLKTGDRSSALKGIDLLTKTAGGYTEKVKLEGDSTITIDFGLGNDFTPSNDEKDDSEDEQ